MFKSFQTKFRFVCLLILRSQSFIFAENNPPYQFEDSTVRAKVVSDAFNNALAPYLTSFRPADDLMRTYYFSNIKWTELQLEVAGLIGIVGGLAIEPDRTASLTYTNDGTNDLQSLYFKGTEWSVLKFKHK